ncbi:hypothetical protein pEaSNUABM11_00142 [Erwinia phage pEa_SNUABM_11]|nr:hypothetical protein pEaSNUABM11_00142 [Erwinia phage pEa_SNUABM_11]
MDFAVVSTETIVRMKKATTAALNTERIIDKNIAEHCALLNAVPGVATLWSCEGHKAGSPTKPNKPYLIFACSQVGRPFVSALVKNLIGDPIENYTQITLKMLELPWVGTPGDFQLVTSQDPADYYYAWSIQSIVRTDEMDFYQSLRDEWLTAITKTIKQFS